MRIFYRSLHHQTARLLIGLFLIQLSCTPTNSVNKLSDKQIAVVQQLDQVVIPLQDSNPLRAFTDLTPLDGVLANAQLIGLGEATHGTREFFLMKDRLFRYLVQKHGHRTLLFEASFGVCLAINQYIHGQESTIKNATGAALSLRYWTWQTAEVRDLIAWMHTYNMGKPAEDQLSFYGIDCQSSDDLYPIVSAYLAKTDPDQTGKLAELYADRKRTSEIYELFKLNEAAWIAKSGRQDYEIAKHAARVLEQYQDISTDTFCSGSNRDNYLAENTRWVLQALQVGKTSLWAHNHHISNTRNGYCTKPMMGSFLKQTLKSDYLAIGMSLGSGMFNATDPPPAAKVLQKSIQTDDEPESFNYIFDQAQAANFALNLNQSNMGAALASWLTEENPFFEAGSYFNEKETGRYYTYLALKNRYDLVIHFRNTSTSNLLGK
jgi:erythromycin esterase